MTEWCVSYSEGYTIDTTEGGRSAGKHEVQVVVYPRGGDVEAIFVVGSNTGGAVLARARGRRHVPPRGSPPTRRRGGRCSRLSGRAPTTAATGGRGISARRTVRRERF